MKTIITITLTLILLNISISQTQKQPIQNISYSYCESENGQCLKKCSIKIISGSKITYGSYIKVYIGKELITEGYVLKHVSGEVFILKDKKDAKNRDIIGGCADDGTFSIDLNKKQVWGC